MSEDDSFVVREGVVKKAIEKIMRRLASFIGNDIPTIFLLNTSSSWFQRY